MERPGVGIRVHRDAFDARLAARAGHADRYLAAVGDEHARQRHDVQSGVRLPRNARIPSWPSSDTRRLAMVSAVRLATSRGRRPATAATSAFAGVIHQQSRGLITEEGLRPQQFSIRRGEGEAEVAEFNRETNALSLKRNGRTRTLPLTESMQDMQSFLFQLAYDAPHLAENDEKLDIVVTNARKVYRYQFRKLGTETLETRFGVIDTIRLLSGAANPEDQYEVWLAPGYFYLPIRLKYYLGRFEVEQMATRIGVSSDAAAR